MVRSIGVTSEYLKKNHGFKEVYDLSPHENDNRYLEGTGAMVLDRENKIAYMNTSKRSDESLLNLFCKKSGYSKITFKAKDKAENPIYHTNVMMSIGTGYAIVNSAAIDDQKERDVVLDSLKNSGHEIIEISFEQMNKFAGNALELTNKNGKKYLAISSAARTSLTIDQFEIISKYASIIDFNIKTIEKGGGSIRCMMAEIF